MLGYGLKASDTQSVACKNGHFNYDALALRDKMVVLERRMRELSRLATILQANNLTGIDQIENEN